PADQLRGKSDVLATSADGQRELVFTHQDDGTAQEWEERHFVDLSRLDGVRDQFLGRFAPSDDVDPLASELVDDALDAGPLDADTGYNGIDVGFARADRHLSAVSGLARQHLDGDAQVGDLRDLG